MSEKLYKYVWGNDKTVVGRWRKNWWQGRICRILVHNKEFNSVLIEFTDNGEHLNTSLNALRLCGANRK